MGSRWNSKTPISLLPVDVVFQSIRLTLNASHVQLIFTKNLRRGWAAVLVSGDISDSGLFIVFSPFIGKSRISINLHLEESRFSIPN